MTKKGNVIYKLISILTLVLPMSVYLFINAVLFDIEPDVIIYGNKDDLVVVENGDEYFLYSADLETRYNGLVIYNSNLSQFGVNIKSNDSIIKIGHEYYNYTINEGVGDFADIKRFEIEKQQSYKIPLSFVVSLLAVGIVALVVSGKMKLLKNHPRLATLIALLTGTGILWLISTLVASLLYVFLVASISWCVYCIEYLFVKGKIDKKEATEKVSLLEDLIRKVGNKNG